MFQIKVYKYDSTQEANGYRGQEFSGAILQGCETKEDITQELDTAEITLCGQTFREEFLPQTKFIVDFIEQEDADPVTSHWVVQKDIVEQPIMSDDSYFDHHISLIEPSVVAQQRLVDNIAVTYKLKDVTLETPQYFEGVTYRTNFVSGEFTPERNFGKTSKAGFVSYDYYTYGKYFTLSDGIKVFQNGNDITNYFIDITHNADIYFVLPYINIFAGIENTRDFINIGRASYDYLIEEFSVYDENKVLRSWTGSMIENTALNHNYFSYYSSEQLKDEWIVENCAAIGSVNKSLRRYYRKYVDTTQETAPTYQTQTITTNPNCIYKITMYLHEFDDEVPRVTLGGDYRKFNGDTPVKTVTVTDMVITQPSLNSVSNVYLENSNTSSNATIRTYNNASDIILLKSSVPYSALTLLQKAIINSNIYEKQDNIYAGDVNNSNLPFVIDGQFIDKLKDTSIIENFYNQKNLWEIMLDVGHYIHAIPELKFGADDKFLITFNELGRTDQQTNLGTKVSIFNSRGVEDYIASTSSYVTNMVQLGGEIREWVAPKTSSEDMLVYNDTAEIITSKPIIELLEIRVKKIANNSDNNIPQGTEKDMTKYIFEKNVYNILGINYKQVPNRGIAMYYELGTNKIVGGNYQLPQANTNLYTDYAIKKIIYCACHETYPIEDPPTTSIGNSLWYNLKVNDYVFFVRYRTKDTVRQTHTRPDLRKYLLNSKYDRYPEHNQFNNQTDILVDSEKFGNNLFGKLIKTGNSTYEVTEWHNAFDTLKHKGELYRINGELYYVAKVTHYWYVSHIISNVTFSKDYNELSAVIGIPSEPRFYEISEQSAISREVSITDFLMVTDDNTKLKTSISGDGNFLRTVSHISGLMLGDQIDYARFALTVFKGDKDSLQELSQQNFYREILSPINSYSSGNTLTYEWDMVDNYSAGDKIIGTETPSSAMEGAYNSLLGVNYTDIYGKSALMDFFLFGDLMPIISDSAIAKLPLSPILTHKVNIVGIYSSQTPTDEQLTSYINTTLNRPPIDYDAVALPKASSGVNKGTFNLITDLGLDVNATDMAIAIALRESIGRPDDGDYCYVEIPIGNEDTATIVTIKKFGSIPSFQTYAWTFKSYLNTYVYIQNQWIENAVYYKQISNLWNTLYATNVKQEDTNYNGRGICLLKDNREQISVNYNLQLLTNSDTFVISPFVFKPNKPNLRVVFLSQEVNKFTDGYISQGAIIRDVEYGTNSTKTYFTPSIGVVLEDSPLWIEGLISQTYVNIQTIVNQISDDYFTGANNKQKIKSIALVYNVIDEGVSQNEDALVVYKLPFIIAKNIPDNWTKQDVAKDWYFGVPVKDAVFTKKQ